MFINNKNNNFSLINTETGEKIEAGPNSTIIVLSEEEQEKRKKEEEDRKKREELEKYLDEKRWVASKNEEIIKLNEKLDIEHAGACMILSLFMNMNSDGRLDMNGKPLKKEDIYKVLKVKKTRGNEIISKLLSRPIAYLQKGAKNGRYDTYKINPKYHTIGKQIDSDIKFSKIFKEQTKQLLERVELKHMGMLYKLLPNVHYQSAYLCHNPNENLILNEEKSWFDNYAEGTYKPIEHYTLKDIGKVAGISSRTVDRWLPELQEVGIIKYELGRGGIYLIRFRPDMVIRTSKKNVDLNYFKILMADFRELDRAYEQKQKEAQEKQMIKKAAGKKITKQKKKTR